MYRDFTLDIYDKLLCTLIDHGYTFVTLEKFFSEENSKIVVLRHDVDKYPNKALRIAEIENKKNIPASYYFRIVKKSNDPKIIKKIIKMGHEIGYHYEDLTLANGNFDQAIINFEKNLDYFKKFYPIKTICMHGSPLSRWDNSLIWRKISYNEYGIIGEPYFDIDYTYIDYFTDTGRKWNSGNENIRDIVNQNKQSKYKSTFDLINGIKGGEISDKIIINVHPQRWCNEFSPWLIELIFQNMKNTIKKIINLK